MKKIIFMAIASVILGASPLCGQALRVSYDFYRRHELGGGFHRAPDMMLDYDGDRAVFYCDAAFYRDSLSWLAFDPAGNVRDDAEYARLLDYSPALNDAVFIDFSSGRYDVAYNSAPVCVIGQDGKLEMPQWELTGEESVSKTGYNIKKAEADYMGRHWVVWFTEDVPVPAGPWLLWGTPGLVTEAFDSEKTFCFKLLFVQEIDNTSRYDELKHYYNDYNHKKYRYGMKEAESVRNKLMRDSEFLDKMYGVGHGPVVIVDKNGKSTVMPTEFPYIPLIPDRYFDNK